MKFWLNTIKTTVSDFLEDKALRLAAALAYYSMFSLAPLLVIIIAVVGFLMRDPGVQDRVYEQLGGVLGPKAVETVRSMASARTLTEGSTIAMILGIAALLLGASGVFGQLQDALNTVWEVKAKPGGGIWRFIRDRFLSLSMVLGLGFLLLMSMVLTTAVEAMTTGIGQRFPLPDAVTMTLSLLASFLVVTVLFALIFKVLPDVTVPWKMAWIGGLATAVLFTIGKWGLGLYLGKESTESAYGAAGSVIIVLLWIYYSSVILLFGAEFTQAYATAKGVQLRASEYAVPVTPESRAQEGLDASGGAPRPAATFAKTGEPQPGSQGPLAVLHRDAPVHPWRSVMLAWTFGILTGWVFRRKGTANAKI